MAQVVEHLPRKCKALSSKLQYWKKKKKDDRGYTFFKQGTGNHLYIAAT
jgi:hypothetical protein